jgi:hypothetical protein
MEQIIRLPVEAAKSTAAYQTDPEIRLGCIIVSGTLDTPRLTQVLQAVPGVERVEEA